jgi:hypothetical protein
VKLLKLFVRLVVDGGNGEILVDVSCPWFEVYNFSQLAIINKVSILTKFIHMMIFTVVEIALLAILIAIKIL